MTHKKLATLPLVRVIKDRVIFNDYVYTNSMLAGGRYEGKKVAFRPGPRDKSESRALPPPAGGVFDIDTADLICGVVRERKVVSADSNVPDVFGSESFDTNDTAGGGTEELLADKPQPPAAKKTPCKPRAESCTWPMADGDDCGGDIVGTKPNSCHCVRHDERRDKDVARVRAKIVYYRNAGRLDKVAEIIAAAPLCQRLPAGPAPALDQSAPPVPPAPSCGTLSLEKPHRNGTGGADSSPAIMPDPKLVPLAGCIDCADLDAPLAHISGIVMLVGDLLAVLQQAADECDRIIADFAAASKEEE